MTYIFIFVSFHLKATQTFKSNVKNRRDAGMFVWINYVKSTNEGLVLGHYLVLLLRPSL